MSRKLIPAILLLALLPALASAQTRDEKVRSDRDRVEDDDKWIYGDLPLGIQIAKNEGKPLLVVFRCIPCEACALLDEQVVGRDPEVRAIMDQFVCVRIPKGNAMDLTQFQFDYDLSFQAFFMNADGTIYGRYGTRSSREHADRDVSIEGFAASMQGALKLHQGYPGNAAVLEGKQPKEVEFKRPEDYPFLKGKYKATLDFAGETAKSCLHCHQIRDAERRLVRDRGLTWTDQVLYPYPTPDVLGIGLDPNSRATVASVEESSLAAKADLAVGDQILLIDGQAVLSPADIQWVLHHKGSAGKLEIARLRGDGVQRIDAALPTGWREASDISWRVSTWNLRRMAFGGMVLEPLREEQRSGLGLEPGQMGLHARHVGQYGEHARAKQAGLVKGDVIVAFNEWTNDLNETQLIAKTLKETKPGDTIPVVYLRDGKRHTAMIKLQ